MTDAILPRGGILVINCVLVVTDHPVLSLLQRQHILCLFNDSLLKCIMGKQTKKKRKKLKRNSGSSCTCCWNYYDLWSVANCESASHKQHTEQLNKCPALCITDLTRWQIAIAGGTLNPLIVSESCCPVICRCSPATLSVFEFLMSHSLSQSRSVMGRWLPERARADVLYVSERQGPERRRGKMGESKGKIGTDSWTDGRTDG